MADTTIGPSIVIDGELKSQEDIVIQGTIKGRLQTTAALLVEPAGRLEADVQARSVEIRGRVSGNVHVSEKYELMKDGLVEGDVHAPRVVIADGARFKGRIEMEEAGGPAGRPAQAKGGSKTSRR